MEKETMGTVISVTKQWWLKVNRKPVRAHAMNGAAFPHIIKVEYTISGKDYTCKNGLVQDTKFLTREQRLKLSIMKINHQKQE
ncbi:sugar ABC transporter permease [Clostridioides difficile]|nr:sugar ABC transporter permease [Clostridioides difficile]